MIYHSLAYFSPKAYTILYLEPVNIILTSTAAMSHWGNFAEEKGQQHNGKKFYQLENCVQLNSNY
jgi:hypothetical protein